MAAGLYSFLSGRRDTESAVEQCVVCRVCRVGPTRSSSGALTDTETENITQLQSCPRSLVGHHNTFEGIQPVTPHQLDTNIPTEYIAECDYISDTVIRK